MLTGNKLQQKSAIMEYIRRHEPCTISNVTKANPRFNQKDAYELARRELQYAVKWGYVTAEKKPIHKGAFGCPENKYTLTERSKKIFADWGTWRKYMQYCAKKRFEKQTGINIDDKLLIVGPDDEIEEIFEQR
jgi:hypothetical protein